MSDKTDTWIFPILCIFFQYKISFCIKFSYEDQCCIKLLVELLKILFKLERMIKSIMRKKLTFSILKPFQAKIAGIMFIYIELVSISRLFRKQNHLMAKSGKYSAQGVKSTSDTPVKEGKALLRD